jgi:hypothetical protein
MIFFLYNIYKNNIKQKTIVTMETEQLLCIEKCRNLSFYWKSLYIKIYNNVYDKNVVLYSIIRPSLVSCLYLCSIIVKVVR